MLPSDRRQERGRREVRRRRARGQGPVEEDLDRKRDVVLGLAAKGQGSQENRLQWSGLPGESSHHGHPQGQVQGVFFDWSPLKCLSMELALPPQFQTGPPPTQNVIKFVKELQYNT